MAAVGTRRWLIGAALGFRLATSIATALGAATFVMCLTWAACARADEPHLEEPSQTDRTPPPEAREHYERGRDYFRAGRYGEAIVELKAALALDPESRTLLYNVAYTSELLGSVDEAISYYEKYLTALPESETGEREKTEVTLRRLRGRRAEQATAPQAQPESTPAPSPEPSAGRADVWFWLSLGAGVASLAGGAVTGVLALQRENDVSHFVVGKDGSLKDHDALIDQANTLALSSDVLVAAGGAFVVTAALLYFLRDDTPEPPQDEAVAASLISNGRTTLFTLHGRF
jgi:tetratricopeptide (TPR) repeat protein